MQPEQNARLNSQLARRYRTEEHKIIESISDWSESPYIGDDCAVLSDRLVTSDTLVEGTHFLRSLMSLEDIGWKAAAVNLSDIAAMAGRPRHLIVSLTVFEGFARKDFKSFFRGLCDCARTYRAQLAGGDLTRGSCMSVTVTALGDANENGTIFRSGAREGDIVAVTGDFAASRAGLWALEAGEISEFKKSAFAHCLTKHCRPVPRLKEAWALAERVKGRGALMDASDGLADALVQIALKSGVGMEIDLEKVPVNDETRRAAEAYFAFTERDEGARAHALFDWVLYGGEDFELVACIPEEVFGKWTGDSCPFTMIGRVTSGAEVMLKLNGKPFPEIDLSQSFQHLSPLPA